MPATFENLKLNRIIVHEVLRASDVEGERKPSYSEDLISLDPRGSQLLSKRLTDSLGSESHSVELDVELDKEGSSFDLVTRLLDARSGEFVRLSKDLAARLTNAQNAGTIKAGIAVVLDGTMGSNARPTRFVAVVKAESDSAFIQEKTPKGLLLKFISDMVLGAQQRLYKIGCFVEAKRQAAADGDGVRLKGDFEVMVYDHQMSNTGDNNAARYFYGTFLGCRLADNAPRLTRIFYEQTSEFINGLNLTAEKRIEAKEHLVSYLKSQDKHFSVKEFADRYLPPALRDTFFQKFKKLQFPTRNITKDIAPIKRRLQVRRLMFTSKVRISAPGEGFDELVKVVEESPEFTTVQIAGSLEAQV